MSDISITKGHISIVNSIDLVATYLPITNGNQQWRMIYRTVTPPLYPGDCVQAQALIGVLNETHKDGSGPSNGINVGVGANMQFKDVDGDNTYYKIGRSTGDNVDPKRHHLPLKTLATYVVPDTWVPGNRGAIKVQANAHSTATYSGAKLYTEEYGELSAVIIHG